MDQAFGTLAPNGAQEKLLRLVRGSRLKRGAFRPMVSRLLNLIRSGPIDSSFQGASFRFYHQASGTERGALLNPSYNIEELDFLRSHTPSEGVFVDVGANVGIYAAVMAGHVGPSGSVIAIEPHPVAYERLAFNCAASGHKSVRLVQAAAGASDGELLIETDGENLGASHVVESSSVDSIRVPARRLLSVLQEAGVLFVDALKIDVEGYEDRVLAGFFRDATQALWPRAVVIEHLSRGEWQQDCIEIMLAVGYDVKGKTRSNTLLARAMA